MSKLDIKTIKKFTDYNDIFVETGTFTGTTTANMVDYFNEIYSVEYLEENFIKCQNKFIYAKNVHLYIGHSPEFLAEILPSLIDRKIVFWLDAHRYTPYGSGDDNYNECPIIEELKEIKKAKLKFNPIMFIDDYNLFEKEVKGFPGLDKLYSELKGFNIEIHENNILIVNHNFYE